MHAGEILRMAYFEKHFWWYKCLHSRVRDVLVQNEIKSQAKILDLACGSGGLMLYLKNQGYTNLQGVDISVTAVNLCNDKKLQVIMGDMTHFHEYFLEDTFDVIICNDALYFLSEGEKRQLFKAISNKLNPGGLCIMNAPALKLFKGKHDESVGIYHRTNKRELNQLTHDTPLYKQWDCHWPFLLSPLILTSRLKQKISQNLFKNTEVTSDLYPLPSWLNACFYAITQFERKLPFQTNFGSSLFTIWKKI
jgi:2-polyprenyl-3-methyl-5-hydroxy-6-metoxy-1,4-benzoquinol methylase